MLNTIRSLAAAALFGAIGATTIPALAASTPAPALPDFSEVKALNTNATSDDGDDSGASIATDFKGTWIVVWQSTSTMGGTLSADYDILLTRSTDDGKHWSEPSPVNTTAGDDLHDDIQPSIATDGNGQWVVIWRSDNPMDNSLGLDPDLLVAYSTDYGRTWTKPEPLYDASGTDDLVESRVSIANDGHGGWAAAFAAGSDKDLEALRRNLYVSHRPAGTKGWTDPVQVNPTIATERRTDNTSPSLTVTPDGDWVVIWRNFTADIADIYQSRSTDGTKTWETPQPLYPRMGSSHSNSGPRLATNGLDWVSAWVSADFDLQRLGKDQDLVFVRSADAGETWSLPKQLNTDAATDSRRSRDELLALAAGRGKWLAVWSRQDDQENHGNDIDLRASVSSNGSAWSAPFFINTDAVTDNEHDLNPAVAGDDKGIWLVVWERADRSGGPNGSDRDLFFAISSDQAGSTPEQPKTRKVAGKLPAADDR